MTLAHTEAGIARFLRDLTGVRSVPVELQVYWTLYTGVLAFWASDASPGQEDTRALLDHSLKTFAGSLGNTQAQEV